MVNTDQYLNTAASTAVKSLFTLRTIDDGKSIRTFRFDANKLYTFTVSGSETKENAGMLTDRKVVRIDLRKTDTTTGRVANAAAYLVVAAPQQVTTEAEMQGLVFALFEWLATGGNSAVNTVVATTHPVAVSTATTALLQGSI